MECLIVDFRLKNLITSQVAKQFYNLKFTIDMNVYPVLKFSVRRQKHFRQEGADITDSPLHIM